MLKIVNGARAFWLVNITSAGLLVLTYNVKEFGFVGLTFTFSYLVIGFYVWLKYFDCSEFLEILRVVFTFMFWFPILIIMTIASVGQSAIAMQIMKVVIMSGLCGLLGSSGFAKIR